MNSDFLLFSTNRDCQQWVKIPLEIIQEVEYEGSMVCRDHQHPFVRLHLKSSEGGAGNKSFADLLTGNVRDTGSPTFTGDSTLAEAHRAPATQRIDIQFQANGNGTLTCSAGTFPCLGRPGLRYPTDITITTSDKQGTHYSNEFHVWMPYSILIWGQRGIYIHEWPFCQASGGASAGCVHLCPRHAATVYNWIVGRTRITISYPW